MAKELMINTSECTGCGLCAQLVPDVFSLGDDNLAKVTNQSGANADAIQEAIDSCPVTCIQWK